MAKTTTAPVSNSAAALATAKAEFAAKQAAAAPAQAVVTPIAEAAAPVIAAPAEADISYMELFAALAQTLMPPTTASWTRRVIGWALGVAAALGTGYLVGMAANVLLATAFVSTSMFFTVVVWVLSVLIAVYLGSKVGSAVSNGIVHKTMENVATGAWNSVSGWFTSAKPVVATPAPAAA